MAQKPALGKGLASLLPSSAAPLYSPPSPPPFEPPPSEAASSPGQNKDRLLGISMALVEDIQTNPFQPRKEFEEAALTELAKSIASSGIIQPLVVRKTPGKEGFELIAGERRLRAAKLAGIKHVPIVIRKSTDKESLEVALIENIQRQNLNCVDEAQAYQQLTQEFSLTQDEVSARVGKDRATISNYLRLLRLPSMILEDLRNQILTFGHGKALLALDDDRQKLQARNHVLKERLSVRETESYVAKMKESNSDRGTPGGKPKVDPLQDRLRNLSRDLEKRWSTQVKISGTAEKGKIQIHYASRQELDRILADMQNDVLLK